MKQNVTLVQIERLLGQLGISKHGAAIYHSLLVEGKQTISDISRNTVLERTQLYRVMPSLVSAGLVGKVPQGKRTFFTALSPERLKELWDETSKVVDEMIPELAQLFRTQEDRPNVVVLKGRKGVVAVYDDIIDTLPKGGIFYRYSSTTTPKKHNHYVSKDYTARRDAKQIERFVITSKKNASRKSARLEKAVRVIPDGSDLFAYNITQLIYGGKIAFVDYNTETAIIIENPIIAQFQERLFRLLYQRL